MTCSVLLASSITAVLLALGTTRAAGDDPRPITTYTPVPVPAPAPSPAPGPPRVIDSAWVNALVDEAQTNHPGLAAARHRERASERGVEAVRLWPDPMIRLGGAVASSSGPNLEMEGDLRYEFQQGLPLFGKATAMRQEAEATAAVARASTTYQFQILRRSIVQGLHRLALADETLRVWVDDLALLNRMSVLVRERQRAGLDPGLEILRLENVRKKREQEIETARRQREFEAVSLNRLLARPPHGPWPTLALPPPAPAVPWSEDLVGMAIRFEPRLQVLRREIQMADATAEVTRRNRRPEVSLAVEGRQWSGSGDFREGMVGVGLSLPWFNRRRYRADMDRDHAKAAAIRAEAEDYENEIRRELFRVWARIDAARREALLYRDDILPRSELAIQTSLAGWAAGRTLHLEVHEAHRMLVEARLMYARASSEQHQMIAELVTCCGVAELDSLSMLGIGASGEPSAISETEVGQ